MRLVVVGAALCAITSNASAAPALSAFSLPGRTAALSGERIERIAALVARRLGAPIAAPARARLPLRGRLERAHDLAVGGSLDAAASLYDTVLEEAARAPQSIAPDEQAVLVAGQIQRASIALARGEVGRARQLLARLVRWDPLLTLAPVENAPPMRALLGDVRKPLGPQPALESGDLGESCHGAIVIVARKNDLERFDDCQPITRANLAGEEEDAAVILLSARPLMQTTVQRSPAPSRAKIIGGSVLLAGGVALAATGIYFAARAAADATASGNGCSASSPCAGSVLASRAGTYDTERISAGVLLSIGAAALVTGSLVTYFGVHPAVRSLALAPLSSGAMLSWETAF